jgi:hypothetical protein
LREHARQPNLRQRQVAYFKLSEKGRCAVAWVGFEGPMELRDAVKFALRRSSPEQQPRHERKQEKKEKKDSLKKKQTVLQN